MKLKAVIPSLDDVEEAFRPLYVAFDIDGTEHFKLDVDGIAAHPETTALKTALDRQKTRTSDLSRQVNTLITRLEDVPEDFDPDLYERAKTEGVGGAPGKIPNEDEIRQAAATAARSKAEAEFKKERDKLEGERDRLKARVEKDVRVTALNEALDSAGVTDPVYRKAARAMLASNVAVKFDDDSGEYVAVAHDADLGDIPVAEQVKAWANTEEGKAFVGARGSGGGGANGGDRDGKPPTSNDNPFADKTFNVTRQSELRKDNPDKARSLAREAGLKVTW